MAKDDLEFLIFLLSPALGRGCKHASLCLVYVVPGWLLGLRVWQAPGLASFCHFSLFPPFLLFPIYQTFPRVPRRYSALSAVGTRGQDGLVATPTKTQIYSIGVKRGQISHRGRCPCARLGLVTSGPSGLPFSFGRSKND